MMVRRKKGLKRLLDSDDLRAALGRVEGGEELLARLATLSERLRGVAVPETAETTATVVSPGNIALSLMHSFDMRELSAAEADRSWALDNARVVVVDRKRRFTLTAAARAACLDAAVESEALTAHLEATREADADVRGGATPDFDALVGAMMRELMRGRDLDPARISSVARRALVEARRGLDALANLPRGVPTLACCESQAALADLLDPLGLMIGLGNPLHRDGQRDRFVGRDPLLQALRRVVDLLDSETNLEATTRFLSKATSSVQGLFGAARPPLLLLKADGGLGKSTLIAKFILDHARSDRRFPFAILDFDRAGLEPRNTAALMSEIARQIGLQYPEIAAALDRQRRRLDRLHAEGEVVDLRRECELLWDAISVARRGDEYGRMLLTLDTLEIVEPDTLAMDGVSQVACALADAAGAELCVVASGRSGTGILAEMLNDRFAIEAHDLKPFSVDEAQEMVARLGRDLLGADWDPAWERKLAGRAGDPPIRREPLSLRIAVELIRDADEDARASLVGEIERDAQLGGETFVGRLYHRRILGSLRDERARALAWPGLVARRVTRTLARDVLAPFCGMSPQDAVVGFEMLMNEGWIVERVNDALVHRRDLRARTLPLMRAKDEKLFCDVAAALADYYTNGPEPDPVEALYCRMLCDEGFAETLPPEALAELAISRGDFPPRSRTRDLIDAAVAQRPLSGSALARLPSAHAHAHNARIGARLRTFDDMRIEPRVLSLARMEPPRTDASSDIQSAWQHLKIKTGEWDAVDPYALMLPGTEEDLTLFGFHAAARTRAGDVKPGFWAEVYPETIRRLTSDRVRKNWRALATALEIARAYDPQLARYLDETLAATPPREGHWARSAEIGLRTLLRNGDVCFPLAFSRWCRFEAHRVENGGLSRAEVKMLIDVAPDPSILLRAIDGAFGSLRTYFTSDLVRDKETTAAVAKIFHGWGDGDKPPPRDWLHRYLDLRAPEWVVPLAYLIVLNDPSAERARSDPLAQLAAADREGHLPEVAQDLTRAAGIDALALPKIVRKLTRKQ